LQQQQQQQQRVAISRIFRINVRCCPRQLPQQRCDGRIAAIKVKRGGKNDIYVRAASGKPTRCISAPDMRF
jgi:hypothetical protein